MNAYLLGTTVYLVSQQASDGAETPIPQSGTAGNMQPLTIQNIAYFDHAQKAHIAVNGYIYSFDISDTLPDDEKVRVFAYQYK